MEKIFSRKTEDYLEAIFKIKEEKGYAKIKDISSFLDVKPPSAVEMVKKLNDRGLAIHKKYECVTLTPEGEEIGRIISDRHATIRAFLEIISVPKEIADSDACVMEHELHPETIGQIKNLVSFVKSAPDHPEWLEHFEIFCKTGEHTCGEKKHAEGEKAHSLTTLSIGI